MSLPAATYIEQQAGPRQGVTRDAGIDQTSREDDAATLQNDERDPRMVTKGCNCDDLYDDDNDEDDDEEEEEDYQKPVAVYEAWEVISVRPRTERTGFKRVLGATVASTYATTKDGYTGVRGMQSFTQAELAGMVSGAEGAFNAAGRPTRKGLNWLRSTQKKNTTYAQDLATRLFALPAGLPSKLGALLDSRFVATNKNQCARREWKVVLLRPVAAVMTDDGTPEAMAREKQVTNHNFRRRWFSRCNNPRNKEHRQQQQQDEPIQKWLVVIRCRETRFNPDGYPTFSTSSNPWHATDKDMREGHHFVRRQQ